MAAYINTYVLAHSVSHIGRDTRASREALLVKSNFDKRRKRLNDDRKV